MKPLFAQPTSNQAHALFQQAWTLHQNGQIAQALPLYEQVIRLLPKHFDALHLAGVIALQLGDAQKAVDLISKALKCDRDNVSAISNRGAAYAALQQFDMALLNYNKAISLQPGAPKSYNNRGNTLIKLNRLEEALADFDKAIALDPAYFAAHNNRGTVLGDMRRYDEARASFEKAIELDPQSVDAHWNLGMYLLRLGEFERGWLESEWRLQRPQVLGLKDSYPMPMWDGVVPLDGKTILICAEQGLGDTIQFCRYAPLIAAMGARVLLEVQPTLMDLLKDLPGVTLIPQGSDTPPCDYHCPLMSVPKLLRTDLGNMPPPSVIKNDEARLAAWRARLGDKTKPRVGIVWSGNASHVDDHKRSIALKDFVALLSDDIQWVSLHKDVRDTDLATLKSRPDILHFGQEQEVFGDAAALSELMDAVVAVDTSLAHLAATMGRPTSVVLGYNADWRWLLDRDDNPWYPSVTVYRQTAPGNWQDALLRTRADLQKRFESQSRA